MVPFIIYCVVYYTPMIKNAPFKSSEFVSLDFKWGDGAALANHYNSATGQYQYLNKQDSLIKKSFKLRAKDISYMHNKANEYGLWNFPEVIGTADGKSLRYEFTFTYKRKVKHVVYYANFDGNPKLRSAVSSVKGVVEQTIQDAEKRYLAPEN